MHRIREAKITVSNKRSRLFGILFLPLIALGLLTLCFLGGITSSIPNRAEELYGPPDPDLSVTRHYLHSLRLLWGSGELTQPTDREGEIVEFDIERGQSPDAIIHAMHSVGLIDNPPLFRTYLIYSGLDKQIQAGTYHLSPAMTELEIADALRDPSPRETTLTIIPGWRMEEIAAALPGLGLEITPDVFINEVQTKQLEGFLFPDTYQVKRDISAPLLINTLHHTFNDHLTTQMLEGFENQGLTLREGVILASIIEKEAVLEEEMPTISSVFLNRLRKDMPLGADPTIQYALGYNVQQETWWTNPLTEKDFSVQSPYNTYQNKGLPPGPICNPGLAALEAAAFPANTPYLYFSAACDGSGSHSFSETFQEHQSNICP